MNKTKNIIMVVVIFVLILISFAIILPIIFLTKDDDSFVWKNDYNEFAYIDEEFEKYNYKNIIDMDKSIIDILEKDAINFEKNNMLIINSTYGGGSSEFSTAIWNPFNDEGTINNLKFSSLITPYYDVNGNLDKLVSGTKNTDGESYVVHWEKNEKKMMEHYELEKYDHEIFRYKDKDFILNGHSIWINDNIDGHTKFNFSTSGIGMPYAKDGNGDVISSLAGQHFNSFDIYGENIVWNSRDYGVIYSLKILNEDGSLRNQEDYELNWVLSGNSIDPWYVSSNYEQDGNPDTWENPIIFNGGTNDVNYYNYDHNPNYVPQIFNEWEDKLLKVQIDDRTYDFENMSDAKAFNLLNNDNKFWGAHTVRVINTYLDSVSDTLVGYDPNKLYISIHDNHFPSDVVFKNESIPEFDGFRNSGFDPYSFHAYEDSVKALFGDNTWGLEDKKSFTKIYEIDPEAMTAKLVLNRNNTLPGSEIDQFSDYRSSSTFFSIDGQSYLMTDASMNSSFAFVAFDGIDFNTGELINERTIMDIQWTGDAGNRFSHYRTYPIFANLNNVAYGWNALNMNPYMG